MIVRSREEPIAPRLIAGAINEFLQDVLPRLETLKRAYENRGKITERTKKAGMPNNKLVHAYPRYIATMASGYLIGKPVTYTAGDMDITPLLEAYKAITIDSVDAELGMNASVYGRGVCIVYAGRDARPRAATLPPTSAFVVYDDTVEHEPIFGVHWYSVLDAEGQLHHIEAHVHTAEETIHLRGNTLASLAEVERTPHSFGGVPMVEFWNNADEMGDFEPVLSLIEAYDELESDRVNDKEQFTDAILVLTGCRLTNPNPNDKRTPGQILMQEKTLELPDSDAHVEWLIKADTDESAETLRGSLNEDIHKMSMVPDLTDTQFAGNASGVAMRYKLLGLEQLTSIKERWFREALTSRLQLFCHYLGVLGARRIDPEAITITFTRALPKNESEIAQMVQGLTGIVSARTLLTQLPFVSDPDAEVAAAEEDAEKAAKRQAAAFGGQYADGNEDTTA